jgi:3-oxoacyl-[acyl-carrier protein] reductase
MDLGIAGKRAVVIGGGRGLARGIAEALAGEGVEVCIAGRGKDVLKSAAEEMGRSATRPPRWFACDVADKSDVDRLAEAIGEADIVVNNCGGPPPGPVCDVSDEQWLTGFESIFLSTVRLTRHFLPGMRARGWGRVITIVSSGVVQPIPNLGISNAIRLAVVGWSKTLAGEVAADGVTVNCIAPGRIHTDRVDQLDAAAAARSKMDIDEVRRASRQVIPADRYGTPAEFAAAGAFLASAQASYITGAIHRVDGGMIRSI